MPSSHGRSRECRSRESLSITLQGCCPQAALISLPCAESLSSASCLRLGFLVWPVTATSYREGNGPGVRRGSSGQLGLLASLPVVCPGHQLFGMGAGPQALAQQLLPVLPCLVPGAALGTMGWESTC